MWNHAFIYDTLEQKRVIDLTPCLTHFWRHDIMIRYKIYVWVEDTYCLYWRDSGDIDVARERWVPPEDFLSISNDKKSDLKKNGAAV